ncbi:hypothetical protein CDAR_33291 [Caerostris darwini]|uniref:Uncharacterized protein n=1 Tax=Caerostris darwini TaxID=1538125 RepID=A0AAV4X236_9ARAC|nr:hypothetical protein CDAR_33291 [Caerostris darwini]
MVTSTFPNHQQYSPQYLLCVPFPTFSYNFLSFIVVGLPASFFPACFPSIQVPIRGCSSKLISGPEPFNPALQFSFSPRNSNLQPAIALEHLPSKPFAEIRFPFEKVVGVTFTRNCDRNLRVYRKRVRAESFQHIYENGIHFLSADDNEFYLAERGEDLDCAGFVVGAV